MSLYIINIYPHIDKSCSKVRQKEPSSSIQYLSVNNDKKSAYFLLCRFHIYIHIHEYTGRKILSYSLSSYETLKKLLNNKRLLRLLVFLFDILKTMFVSLVESKQFAWMVVFVFDGFDLEGNTNTKISQGKITNQNLLKKKERVASLLYNH